LDLFAAQNVSRRLADNFRTRAALQRNSALSRAAFLI
jgi:hypothetical protein